MSTARLSIVLADPLLAALLVVLLMTAGACGPLEVESAAAPGAVAPAPAFDQAFWDHWGDGRAEVAGYRLTTDRYGAPREGSAVAIFVTETFLEDELVKADRPAGETFPVIKLNLVEDFPTGIYDYNLMTSAFVALTPRSGWPAGVPAKISFSAQEWCGHVYEQARYAGGRIEHDLHSYFQDEADRRQLLDAPAAVLSEDTLLLWARGLAWPAVAPGATATVPVATSLARARLSHTPPTVGRAELSRSAERRTVTIPAGTFEVAEARVRVVDGDGGERVWVFEVEAAPPHRVVTWRREGGGDEGGNVEERAELVGVDRIEYWRLNGPGGEAELARIGLAPRPPGTT